MDKKMKRPTATNFFERQESARKRTCLLVFLFILGVLATAFSIWPVIVGCAMLCLGVISIFEVGLSGFAASVVILGKYAFVSDAILVAAIIGGFAICVGTLYKICELKRLGACGVAEELGGTRIGRLAQNIDERRFYNVVEEMALAAGVPVPAVYVLRDEDGINACAIGGDLGNSAIAATGGALRLLTRDELQGVVAHEFAHLVNGDVKINMRLIGVLFGLQILAAIGIRILRGDIRLVFLGGALFFVGLGGVFIGEMIQMAIARQREMLADASAAQFTRNPRGLANALKKIGGLEKGSKVDSTRSVEMARLFFGSVFSGGFWERIFRTHPDLTERIWALDPTFNGFFPIIVDEVALKKKEKKRAEARNARKEKKIPKRYAEKARKMFAAPPLELLDGPSPAAVVASIGALRPEKLVGVSATLGEIPAEVEPLLADFDGARTVLFALLTDDSWSGRSASRSAMYRGGETDAYCSRVIEAARTLNALPFSVRATVARLAVPALKSGTLDDYRCLRKTAFALADANGWRDLLAFALEASVIRELDVWFRWAPLPQAKFSTFEAVRDPFRTASTYLAFRGASGDEAEARKAFAAGVSALGDVAKSAEKLEPEPFENRSLERFYDAVKTLAQTTPRLKEKLLTAFFACVAADGRVVEAEAELFDAISLALGVPAPVWRSAVDASEAAAKKAETA